MKGLNAPEQARQRHPRPASASAHILVVEDDEDSRELMRLQLKGAGYRVTTAEDAVEAGHCVLERLPDLIVADFNMPYMSGPDFIAALRADGTIPDLPVIFVTDLENSARLEGHTFGFPMLTKPLLADELLAAVAVQLKARRFP